MGKHKKQKHHPLSSDEVLGEKFNGIISDEMKTSIQTYSSGKKNEEGKRH